MSEATLALAGALARASSDMDVIVENRQRLLPNLPATVEGRLPAVWRAIQDQIRALEDLLRNAENQYDDNLSKFGLVGEQLNIKLRAYEFASTRAHGAWERARNTWGRAIDPQRLVRKLFRSLLGYLNVWLGSLVAALGVGHAVKEFKELLERFVEDAEILD